MDNAGTASGLGTLPHAHTLSQHWTLVCSLRNTWRQLDRQTATSAEKEKVLKDLLQAEKSWLTDVTTWASPKRDREARKFQKKRRRANSPTDDPGEYNLELTHPVYKRQSAIARAAKRRKRKDVRFLNGLGWVTFQRLHELYGDDTELYVERVKSLPKSVDYHGYGI